MVEGGARLLGNMAVQPSSWVWVANLTGGPSRGIPLLAYLKIIFFNPSVLFALLGNNECIKLTRSTLALGLAWHWGMPSFIMIGHTVTVITDSHTYWHIIDTSRTIWGFLLYNQRLLIIAFTYGPWNSFGSKNFVKLECSIPWCNI